MTRQADFLEKVRRESWAEGRALQDSLQAEYCRRYGLVVAPPPARIADELITDFLHAELYYDPLPLGTFASSQYASGTIVVTINSRIPEMPGVLDHEGVANVAKWHEIIHLVRDAGALKAQQSLLLDGFEAAPTIVCSSSREHLDAQAKRREFIAEEAGRAAAVCYRALATSEAFLELANRPGRTGGRGWQLLAAAARDIGVNRTALSNQLKLEGRIVVVREAGRSLLYVQPGLKELIER